jgi:hypothetical protein
MDAPNENFTEFTENYVVKFDRALASLEILMRGNVLDLLMYDPGAQARVLDIMFFDNYFQECLARHGLVYHEQADIKGFKAFVGTEDEVFLYFGMENVGDAGYEVTIFGTVYEKANKVASVLRRRWRSLGDSLFNAVNDYLQGPVPLEGLKVLAPAPAAAEAAQAPAAAPNVFQPIIAAMRKQRLKNLYMPPGSGFMNVPHGASVEEPMYNTNENVEVPGNAGVLLRTRLENVERNVDSFFVFYTKDGAYDHLVSESDFTINKSQIYAAIKSPVKYLAERKFLCDGINKPYIEESIDKADIVILLLETDSAGVEDYSYTVGFTTLLVKPNSVEIDLICANIGYKYGGRLLMDRVFKITKALGLEKVELGSVSNKATLDFYRRMGFKKVPAENNFAKVVIAKGLTPYRRRITRKHRGAAGAAGAAAAGAGAAAAAVANKAKKNAKKNTQKNKKPSTQEMYNKQNGLWGK